MGIETPNQPGALVAADAPENAAFADFSEELVDKGFITTHLDKVVNDDAKNAQAPPLLARCYLSMGHMDKGAPLARAVRALPRS